MAWSYKDYKDNQETVQAKAQRDKIASQKPASFSYADYVESDTVKAAKDALNQQLANKPGAYQSQWQQSIDDTLNKILNREKFTYDLNGDALYQQYKDQYTLQGKQAMMDTMGQAAALTGGYGNSYAQTVGQQTYQGYLQQLNDKIPELYQLALDQYNREGDDLYNQYGLFSDRENTDYGRYRDTVSDWTTERNYLQGRVDTESDRDYGRYTDNRNFDYGQYRDTVSDWQNELNRADSEYWNNKNFGYGQYSDDRNVSYTQYRDTVSDEQWQKTFDEGVRQFNEQMAYNKSKSSGGGSGSGGSQSENYKTVESVAKTFSNNDALFDYLGDAVDKGYITAEEMDKLYSKHAITKNLNTSGSKYAYGTGATGGYNKYTQAMYPNK